MEPGLNLMNVMLELKGIYEEYQKLWIRAEQDDLSAAIKKRIVTLNHGIGSYVEHMKQQQQAVVDAAAKCATQEALNAQKLELCSENKETCNGAATAQ